MATVKAHYRRKKKGGVSVVKSHFRSRHSIVRKFSPVKRAILGHLPHAKFLDRIFYVSALLQKRRDEFSSKSPSQSIPNVSHENHLRI
ncbi:hypothetical protein [Flammeovirga agarivorans]|uniref:Uncharacterized protein n=1 Tax=Flammeovirga agarivorans TaxID=2726742 RepID=A0A7X8XZ69_9BACT|nr:hypothetical protein [Flammeovirga agarivorans]NLR94877.1 hypothetical protein [Flammeovirga agarivorans]